MAELSGLLFDVGTVLIAAALMAGVARLLRQPLIIAYIVAGILVGPSVLGLVNDTNVIQLFAELGIAFLLFIVGLELDVRKLRTAGLVSITAAFVKVTVVFTFSLGVALLLDFSTIHAIYIAFALAFSSTAIGIKLLGDKNELNTLHGRIVVGAHLVQDILIVFALSALSVIDQFSLIVLLSALAKSMGLLAFALLLSRFLIPRVLKAVERTPELLFLVATSTLFLFIGLSSGLGFSMPVGAFIAGLSLSAFPYNIEVISRAKPLRDFFVIIFFVSLGMVIDLGGIRAMLLPLLVFLAIVLILKPLLIALVSHLHGYGSKIAVNTGLSLGQVSEFALVAASVGVTAGHISQEVFSLITALLVSSSFLTTYLITYDKQVADWVSRYLISDRSVGIEQELVHVPDTLESHIILLGAHEKGRRLLEHLKGTDTDIVAVEYDPELVRNLRAKGIYCVYGDASNPEVLERLSFKQAAMVISTIPDREDNQMIVGKIKEEAPAVIVFANAEDVETAMSLYDLGADYVLYDKMVASERLLDIIQTVGESRQQLESLRHRQLRELEHRKEEELLQMHAPAFLKSIQRRIHAKERRLKANNYKD